MSAETAQFDYSNDIDTLEALSQGEQSVETGEELFESLENSATVKFLLDNASELHSAKLHPENDDYRMVEEGKLKINRQDAYEQTIEDLQKHQAIREKALDYGRKRGLGQLEFLPGLVDNPVKKGYEDAEDLQEFSKEKLEGVLYGELEYNPSSGKLSEILGTISAAGGMGAVISETLLEPAAEQVNSALNPESVQQAAAQFTGDDAITTGAGIAAFAYGISIVHQSSYYENGVEMKARDEYIDREAEELMEEYRDWRVE